MSSTAVNYISTSQIYEIIKGDLGKCMQIQPLHKTLANRLQDERNWKTECWLFGYTWNAWSVIQLMSHYMHKIQQDWMGSAVKGCFILSDQHICAAQTQRCGTLHRDCEANFIKHKRKSKGGQCENISIREMLWFAATLWISNTVWSARTKRKITQETETLLQHSVNTSVFTRKNGIKTLQASCS